ncbi:MAG: M57 family metalloprotease [Pseudomonadota bacterium]|nr:M57 family metalloprotease [Pseudomonadota bacterium]
MSTQPPRRGRTRAAEALEAQPELRAVASEPSVFRTVPSGTSLLDFVKSTAKRVTIDDEEFFVVESDLLLDEDELTIWAGQREALARAGLVGIAAAGGGGRISDELVGMVRDGKIVRWRDGLELTYCVLKGTFRTQAEYELVRDTMEGATTDWSQTCGVAFRHVETLDESPGTKIPAGVLFAVRGINAQGQFIAAAFFPDDPRSRRRVLIDHSYFTTSFDKRGVLRHELGHVLGFRHEHIRPEAPPACPDEPLFDTTLLGAYDPHSVMHYFCGAVGSRELAITELDRAGSQRVYGGPLSGFFFAE